MTKEIRNIINYISEDFYLNNYSPNKFDNDSLIKLENLMEIYLEQSELEDVDFQLLFKFILIEIFPGVEDFERALYYIKIVLNKIDFNNIITNREIWILFVLNIYTEQWISLREETQIIFEKFLSYYELIDKEVASMVFYEMAINLNDIREKELYYTKSISLNSCFVNSYLNLANLYKKKGMLKISQRYALKALSTITKVVDSIYLDDLTDINIFLKYRIIGNYQISYTYHDIFNEYFLEVMNGESN